MSKHRSGVKTTQRTDTEQAQRRADELFRALIENASDVITILDAEGIIRYESPSVEGVLGYKPHELIGMDIAELLHPDDLSKSIESYGALKAGARSGTPETAQITEKRLRHKDGSWRILESVAKVLDTPSGAGIVINSRDITERKRAEAENARLAVIVNTSEDAIYSCTREGVVVTWNAGAERMFGYTAEEITGKHFRILIPEELRSDLTDNLEKLSRGEALVQYEHENQRKDGSRLQVLLTISLIKDATGFITGGSVITRDITERKRAEEAVRRSEEFLRLVINTTPAFIHSVLPDGTVDFFNQSWLDYLGLRLEDASGWKWTAAIHPEDVAGIVEKWRASLAKGELFKHEARIRRADGEYRWMSLRKVPQRDERGDIVKWYGSGVDIEDQKRAVGSLIEERHLLHTLMDNLPDKIYFKDRESHFTRINLALAKQFGLSHPAHADGKSDFDFYPEDQAREFKRDEEEIIRTGQPIVDKEEQQIWPDGRVTWVSTTKMPLRDPNGDIIGTFGVSRDVTERKKAEETLRESEAGLAAAQRIAHIGSWDWNVQTDKSRSSSETLRIFGQGPQDQNGRRKSFLDMIHPQDRARVDQALTEALNGTREYNLEYRVLLPDASEKVIHAQAETLRDEAGRPLSMRGTIQDITERKRAEEELRLTQFSVEHASDAIMWMDSQGQIVYANDAASRILGRSREEMLSLSIPDIDPLFQKETWVAHWKKIKRLGSMTFETQHQTNQGRVFPVEITANYLEFGGKEYSFAFAHDITERKQAQGEHVRLVTAIEQSAEAVMITNTAGEIEYVNPAFSRITGYSREEVLGQNPRILKSGKQDPELYQQLWATIGKGEIWHGELTNRRKDGSLYTEQMNIAPVWGGGGEITHFIATKQDVTARKLLEQQVTQAQKMEAVGRLAGGVAHDFNNLLTIINGYAQLLTDRSSPQDPRWGIFEEIQMAGERAASLTRQLLAFSRRQVMEPRVLDLSSVLANTEKMLRRLIGEDIELVATLDPGLGLVKVDPGQIEQVVLNLAVNARDAMPEGGKLFIETSNVELDEDDVRRNPNMEPGKYVMVAVSDTGCGMDQETQAHIFEPFFTTKEKGKGTGLGLATVYGIVKQSGGSIWIYSEPGRGSTFKIYFPCVEEALSRSEPAEVRTKPAKGKETVLVVEDEAGVRTLVCETLKSKGYKILQAEGAAQALKIAGQHTKPIHLLLTDVVMPETGGKELTKRLITLHPETKVLFMSGYTDDAIVRHGILAGSMAFLKKPFAPNALVRKIREVLKTKPGAQASPGSKCGLVETKGLYR